MGFVIGLIGLIGGVIAIINQIETMRDRWEARAEKRKQEREQNSNRTN